MTRPKIEIDIKKVEAFAAQGLTEEQIAECLGISIDTLRRRKKDNAEFCEVIKKGKQKGIATIVNALFKKAKAGNVTAMIFFLKNRDPQNWNDKITQEITGKNGEPIRIDSRPDLSSLSDEELDLYERLATIQTERDQRGESEA